MFLNRVLIPLHKVKCLGLYHAQVRKQEKRKFLFGQISNERSNFHAGIDAS